MAVTNQYMVTMKNSGYSEKVRKETVLTGYKGLQEKLRQVSEEGRRMNRHMNEGAKERYKAKIGMKSSWFKGKKQQKAAPVPAHKPNMALAKQRRLAKRKKGLPKPKPAKKQDDREIEGVIFIPHTADNSLRKLLQAEDDDITKVMKMGRTKYVEHAGVKLSSQLVRKNIWYSLGGGCGRPKCYP